MGDDTERQSVVAAGKHGRGGRRRAGIAVALATAAAGAAVAPTQSLAAESTAVALEGCYVSVLQFDDDPERLRAHVPPAYTLSQTASILVTNGTPQASGTAGFMAWTLRCDAVQVGAEPLGEATLVMVGVVVEKPDVELVGVEGPAGFDHYLIAGAADDERLAHALSVAGLPVRHQPRTTFERATDALGTPTTTTTVPGPHGMTFTVPPPPVNDTVRDHPHSNSFWFGDDPATAAELEFAMRARDWFCVGSSCGSISAPEGHVLAGFLGAPQRDDASFGADHVKVETITGQVRSSSA